ncbi:MAG TPA: aromatic ring-hydroxylating dioxygenase subunit alpha [Chloroflexota bacterium]|nr:aromatic ring-hydroxylating dioxygenase subunit alpha [Chloroflexota bacterium]
MSEREQVLERLRATVEPAAGRIPAFIYTNPTVYALELERIFQRAWLFVAHESEVPARGDYVTRHMGEQPVIVSRGEDGVVRVMLNVCRHRAMRVVRADAGNAAHFRCPYHGFTYASTGQLTGVPFQQEAYGDALDRSAIRLVQARVGTYRGLIFATWDHAGETLDEYLGAMKWYLDLVAGRGPMEVLGPPQRWTVPSTWKLPAENFVSDAYHTAYTHASLAKLGLVASTGFGQAGYHVTAGHGHGLGIGIQHEGSPYPPELHPAFEQALTPDQLRILHQVKNLHGSVFPNLSFLIASAIPVDGRLVSGTTLRLWQPRGPNCMEILSWCLVERDAPAWWKAASRTAYVQTFGTSGIFEQDDTENWEAQTRTSDALQARDDDLILNYQMGLGQPPLGDFPGPGVVYEGKFNEANARAFYQQWLDYLLAAEPDRPDKRGAAGGAGAVAAGGARRGR